jgi:hypothetical protein
MNHDSGASICVVPTYKPRILTPDDNMIETVINPTAKAKSAPVIDLTTFVSYNAALNFYLSSVVYLRVPDD